MKGNGFHMSRAQAFFVPSSGMRVNRNYKPMKGNGGVKVKFFVCNPAVQL